MLKNILIDMNVTIEELDYEPAKLISVDMANSNDTLVITDSESKLARYHSQGFAVLAVSDSKTFFEGAKYVVTDIYDCDYEYFEMVFMREKKLPLTILETERALVREMSVEDLEERFKLYEDPMLQTNVEALFSYEEEREYIENYAEYRYGLNGFGYWHVWDKASGELAGVAGPEIREIDGRECLELGYAFSQKYRGTGFAYEVCQGILSYVSEKLRYEYIHIVTPADNIMSSRFAHKLGFVEVDRVRLEGIEYAIYVKKLQK